jgi:hypothetical protein
VRGALRIRHRRRRRRFLGQRHSHHRGQRGHEAGDGDFGVVGPGAYAHVFDLVDVVAQPNLVAQRLGAFRVFSVDSEQGLKARFTAAGLDLDE